MIFEIHRNGNSGGKTSTRKSLDVVAWTEEVGFGGAWVPEHHMADDGYMPSPLIALTAMAARTKRIKLGSAIALAPLYNPVRFAEDCAVLDILSGGRLEMGLAIGYRKRETAAFGVDFTKRGKLFDEWLQIVTRLWAGEEVSFAGKHFNIAGAKLMPPAPRGRIPLFIGSFTDKAMERVARYGDGFIGDGDLCDLYAEKMREQGKDMTTAKVRATELFLVVAEDPEQALEELAPHYHHVNNSYGEWFNEGDGVEGLTADEPRGVQAQRHPADLDAGRRDRRDQGEAGANAARPRHDDDAAGSAGQEVRRICADCLPTR